jgi:AcrR family transcriptional regulator
MALRQRARNDEDKQARRAAILTEAGVLLGEHPYARITMAQVARACGLAKGTLYLYFRSKEELFLALLERELVDWLASLQAQLSACKDASPELLGQAFAASLQPRRTLTELLVILHTILERNVDAEVALAFKAVLRDQLEHSGAALESACPALEPGSGPRTLLRLYALLIGMHQVAHPSPAVAGILAREDMAALRLDFVPDLAQSIAHMLRGATHRGGAA